MIANRNVKIVEHGGWFERVEVAIDPPVSLQAGDTLELTVRITVTDDNDKPKDPAGE